MRIKKAINSPWVISLGTALFSILITFALDLSKNKPFFSTLSYIYSFVVSWVVIILNFKIKLWWMLIVAVLVLVIRLMVRSNKKNESESPSFLKYTQDIVKKWEWSWKWRFDTYRKTWVVSNLKASCPRCSSTMLESQDLIYGYSYQCPRCDFYSQGETDEHPAKIEQLIIDRVKSMGK